MCLECFANLNECVPCLCLVPEEVKFPETGVTSGCKPPCESKPKSPGRVTVFLITEPSLWAPMMVMSAEATGYVQRGPRQVLECSCWFIAT